MLNYNLCSCHFPLSFSKRVDRKFQKKKKKKQERGVSALNISVGNQFNKRVVLKDTRIIFLLIQMIRKKTKKEEHISRCSQFFLCLCLKEFVSLHILYSFIYRIKPVDGPFLSQNSNTGWNIFGGFTFRFLHLSSPQR